MTRLDSETLDAERFFSDSMGLHDRKSEGPGTLVCPPLHFVGYAADEYGGDPAYLLDIQTVSCDRKRIEIREAQLLDPRGLANSLISAGLRVQHIAAAKTVGEFLRTLPRSPRYLRVPRDGWTTSGGYAFGEKLYTATEAPIWRSPGHESAFKNAGTIEDWHTFTRLWKGNSVLTAVNCFALAAPLLRLLGHSTYCVSIVGRSSTGKTTAICSAQALTTKPYPLATWHGTSNGLMAAATQHSDLPFVVDEIGQANPGDVGALIYGLTTGTAKLRATQSGNLAPASTISTVVITAGEESMFERLRRTGRMPTGGQIARFITIPVDDTQGIASNRHGLADSATFVKTLQAMLNKTHGIAWPLYVRYIAKNAEAIKGKYVDRAARIRSNLLSGIEFDPTDNIAARVLEHFVIATLAGFVAVDAKIVDLKKSAIKDAMQVCLKGWLATYSSTYPPSAQGILERVRAMIQERKTEVHTFVDYQKYQSTAPFAFRYRGTQDADALLLINPAAFEGLKLKYTEKSLHDALRNSGWLVTGTEGRPQKQFKIPGGGGQKASFYALREDLLLENSNFS